MLCIYTVCRIYILFIILDSITISARWKLLIKMNGSIQHNIFDFTINITHFSLINLGLAIPNDTVYIPLVVKETKKLI